MTKSRSIALLAGVVLLGFACGAPETQSQQARKMTWEEFQARTFQEPESGVIIYNGDQAAQSLEELREVYEQLYMEERGTAQGGLAVYSSGGVDVRWTAGQALELTYCVSRTFGGNYSKVVHAMNNAANAWEGAGRVNFIHLSSQDGHCDARNVNVVFDVSPVNTGGQYLARAFFPNLSRPRRNVLIDSSSFSPRAPGLDGILRHELGHALGFRHEHTRPEAGRCHEDNQWRALTPYDSSSVMHYPQCNGTNTWELAMTHLDQQGAGLLYP